MPSGPLAGDIRPLAVRRSSPEKFRVRLTDVVGRADLREDANAGDLDACSMEVPALGG